MTVAIWYLTKVLSRGEGSRGTVLPLYLVVDENSNVLDLQQKSTLSTEPNEPAPYLIDVATAQPGYWQSDQEQEFWEQWVMYPELTDSTREEAFASVQTLVRRHTELSFNGSSLKEGKVVRLYLKPLDASAVKQLIMELQVERIYDTVFVKGDTE